MAPSTWRGLPPDADVFGLRPLDRFYRWHAPVYDWTRPFILFGRSRLLAGLDLRAGELVLDVGCGTGWSFERLARRGARVVGVEPSEAMRAQAASRIERRGLGDRVVLDPRPYGSRRDLGSADAVVMSYSLTMMPAFERALQAARADLRPGGTLAVVDFLGGCTRLVDRWLAANHVGPGGPRLERLGELFPRHRLRTVHSGFWRHFLLWARA